MKRFLPVLMLLTVTLLGSGCASKLMSPDENYAKPDENKSKIVFFRSSSMGGAIQAPIGKEDGEEVKFIGIASTDTKIQCDVDPGFHTFVVSGESAQIVKGDVAANKIYYVRVSPRLGWVKARFHPNIVTPEELAKESVQKEIKNCMLVKPNAAGEDWFRSNYPSMKSKLKTGKEKFDGDKDQIILESYGVDQLY